MFVMIIHDSKRKDFEGLQIAFLFCWLLESLVGYMKLKERGFQRPSKLAFPLCYAICG
jgi:hypothetical protein